MKFGSGASTAGGAVASGMAWTGEAGAGWGGDDGGGASVDGGVDVGRGGGADGEGGATLFLFMTRPSSVASSSSSSSSWTTWGLSSWVSRGQASCVGRRVGHRKELGPWVAIYLEQRRSPPQSLARFGNPLPTRVFGRAPSIQQACPAPTCYLHREKMHGLAQEGNKCIRQYATKQTNSAEE